MRVSIGADDAILKAAISPRRAAGAPTVKAKLPARREVQRPPPAPPPPGRSALTAAEAAVAAAEEARGYELEGLDDELRRLEAAREEARRVFRTAEGLA